MVHISREEADSHFSETKETQLATLACVAFVNQQQREPFGSPDANGREDEDDESLSDAATDTAVIVAGSSDDGFKKQFLDRLAGYLHLEQYPLISSPVLPCARTKTTSLSLSRGTQKLLLSMLNSARF